MKHLALILLLVSTIAASAAEPEYTIPETHQLNGRAVFMTLETKEAQELGRSMADADFEKGVYRILVYGLRRGASEQEVDLAKEYKVYVVPVAGCVVTSGITEGSRAYNETMQAHLTKKFGKDVVGEGKY